jgi:Mechanosensitive ion channel, conserved TM helix
MTALIAVEWSTGIEDAWSDVASFVPKFIGFLIILLIGYFVAKLIAKAVGAILERVGFDKAVERGGIKKALENSKFDASDILAKVVFYALFLIVLQMAFGVFGQNPISDLLEGVIAYLPKVIAAILIIVIASAIAAAARELIDASLGGLSYGSTLANATGIAIVVVGIFAALNQLQIAPAIVTGLFYAVLAIIVGSAVIAIGGGGIGPMRSRWDNVLTRYDEEKPKLQQAAQGSKDRIAQRAQQRADQAHSAAGSNLQRPAGSVSASDTDPLLPPPTR